MTEVSEEDDMLEVIQFWRGRAWALEDEQKALLKVCEDRKVYVWELEDKVYKALQEIEALKVAIEGVVAVD